MNMRKLLAAVLALALLMGVAAGCTSEPDIPDTPIKNIKPTIEATAIDFLVDGKSDYQIVTPAQPTENESFAASELQYFIEQASGAKLPIVAESADLPAGKYLYVGATEASVTAGVRPTYDEVQYNGFVIKVKDDDCYLCGYAEYGTRNAVYEFLYYAFDYECYAADEIVLTPTASAKLLNFDLSVTPTFDWREGNYGEIIFDPTLSFRMRFNATEEIFVLGHQTHVSMELVDPQIYDFTDDKYKDWYSSKTWSNPTFTAGREEPAQLCYSNEDMWEVYSENLIKLIAESPVPNMLLGMEDNSYWCDCDECTASLQKYGTNAAVCIPFVNKLQADVNAWFAANRPDDEPTRLVFFAYYETVVPPAKYDAATGKWAPIDDTVKLNPDSAIMFAPIRAEYDIPFDASDIADPNGPFGQVLGWSSISENLFAWTYSLLPSTSMVFFNTVEVMQQNYQLLAESGTVMLLDQTDHYQKNINTSWSRAKAYLMAKLAWNADLSVDELLDAYFANYFGEAGDTMQALFNEHREWTTHIYNDLGAQGVIWDALDTDAYWTYQQLQHYMDQIDRAYADIAPLQASDPARYAQLCDRILLESLQYRYLLLQVYPTEYSEIDLIAARREFRYDFERLGLTAQEEGGDITELWSDWGIN